MRKQYALLFLSSVLFACPAAAQWTSVEGPITGEDIRSVAVHPENGGVIYAGSTGALFRSSDGGKSWKTALRLASSASGVNIIRFSPSHPQTILAGTDEGVYRSDDDGRKWKRIFERPEEEEEKILSLAIDGDRRRILAGSASGLYVSSDGGTSWKSVPQFFEQPVYQIESMEENGPFMAAGSGGLYVSERDLSGWKKLVAAVSPEEVEDAGNAQTGIEEALLQPVRLAFTAAGDHGKNILLIRDRSFEASADRGKTWSASAVNGLARGVSGRPAALGSSGKVFVPAQDEIYFYDSASGDAVPAGWGLPASDIHDLVYHARTDELFAATDKGLFRLSFPETSVFLERNRRGTEGKASEIFAFFAHEPTVQELQIVAMRYAEVHPEKIMEWRRQAALKPWVPSLGIGQDWGRDQNVDIDRGGTADPDKFIEGPAEKDKSFSVNLNWDLSEIIWNPDQASIDNRSKLMVQLREDLLNQLTNLYFARRRLQIETALSRQTEVTAAVERQLQIDEYAAGIDALTGGYLSKKIAETAKPVGR